MSIIFIKSDPFQTSISDTCLELRCHIQLDSKNCLIFHSKELDSLTTIVEGLVIGKEKSLEKFSSKINYKKYPLGDGIFTRFIKVKHPDEYYIHHIGDLNNSSMHLNISHLKILSNIMIQLDKEIKNWPELDIKMC